MLTTLALSASALLLYHILTHFFWRPAAIARKLRQQGLVVLPYRPPAGDLPHIKLLRDQVAASGPYLPSPSHHHIAPLVLPLHSKIAAETGNSPFVYWWGTRPTLVVFSPDDIKQILSSDLKRFVRSPTSFRFLGRLLGRGLLTSEGKDWHNRRSILRHAFFPDKLKGMVGEMSASCLEMVHAWEKKIEDEADKGNMQVEVEVAKDIKSTTADIIARTSFASSYEKGKAVFEKQTLLVRLLVKDRVANTTIPGYKYLPTPSNLRCWQLERSIERELREIVEDRRKSAAKNDTNSYGDDLLGLILSAEEEYIDERRTRLSTQDVIDECKTFFFSGHDTTAHLLAWTMVMLGHHSEWQERARAEVMEVCGRGRMGDPVRADHLHKLKTLGMILNETLRLYPPILEFGPRVLAPGSGKLVELRIHGGSSAAREDHEDDDDEAQTIKVLELPAGTSLSIPLLMVHQCKGLWGEDTEEFQPERFREGAMAACKSHPCGFLPFGFGPRSCIGQTFALMEAKVMLATIPQRFCLPPLARLLPRPRNRHHPSTQAWRSPHLRNHPVAAITHNSNKVSCNHHHWKVETKMM